jgi:hypothetical protein
MPTTYNGIGTQYYGRRNEEKRPGVCPHCGASVELSSYDTRLWFVIVFIPFIPLGRKRVIDQCFLLSAALRPGIARMGNGQTNRDLDRS